jgi:hypothetical protein
MTAASFLLFTETFPSHAFVVLLVSQSTIYFPILFCAIYLYSHIGIFVCRQVNQTVQTKAHNSHCVAFCRRNRFRKKSDTSYTLCPDLIVAIVFTFTNGTNRATLNRTLPSQYIYSIAFHPFCR